MKLLCKCGGEIIFEGKKTFVSPDTCDGMCQKCHAQYQLKAGSVLIKKKEGECK